MIILQELEDCLKKCKELYEDPKYGIDGSGDARLHRPANIGTAYAETTAKGGLYGPKMRNASQREATEYWTKIRTFFRLIKLTKPVLDSGERETLELRLNELQMRFAKNDKFPGVFYAQ